MVQRILVADDSVTIQKVITLALSKYEAEIVKAANFNDAQKKISEQNFDAVIVDVSLSGSSSPDDFHQFGEVPVLVLFGSYDKVSENDLFQAGFKHIIKKPFTSQDFISKLTGDMAMSLQRSGSEDKVEAQKKDELPVREAPPAKLPDLTADNDTSSLTSLDSLATFLNKDDEKGKPAFSDSDIGTGSLKSSPLPPPPPQPEAGSESSLRFKPSFSEDEILKAVQPYIEGELNSKIVETVTSYCQANFKEIAREVITQELRRLADEKSRLLVDN